MRALLQGRQVHGLPARRAPHLQTQNIPFLNNLVNKFTGGDVFIAEIFFVKTQPVRGVPFGGPLESMEDPILFEFVTPRIFGEFSLVVVDPVRFVVGYHGQCGGSGDNDVVLSWIKGKFFMSVKTVIGQVCAQQQKSLLNLGGMSMELGARIVQSAPNLEEIGVQDPRDRQLQHQLLGRGQKLLREANKARGDARRGVGVAQDTARAKQFELDQRFQQDARYVQQLAGNWQNYAAGQAMMGAGQGMAQGGDGSGVAGPGRPGGDRRRPGAGDEPRARGAGPASVRAAAHAAAGCAAGLPGRAAGLSGRAAGLPGRAAGCPCRSAVDRAAPGAPRGAQEQGPHHRRGVPGPQGEDSGRDLSPSRRAVRPRAATRGGAPRGRQTGAI